MSQDSNAARLKNVGLRVTKGRLSLLSVLHTEHSPLTAQEIRRRMKSMDLVTVYRTLQAFVAAGLVQEVRLKDDSVRYECTHGGHHHHVICTECGIIDELPECHGEELQAATLHSSVHFASIHSHSLEFFGICKTCLAR